MAVPLPVPPCNPTRGSDETMPTCEDCRDRPAIMRMNFADHGNTPGGERDVCFKCATGLPGSVIKLYVKEAASC